MCDFECWCDLQCIRVYRLFGIHITVSYNDELYIFGGFDGFQHVHFDDLYKFNPGEKSPVARIFAYKSIACSDLVALFPWQHFGNVCHRDCSVF